MKQITLIILSLACLASRVHGEIKRPVIIAHRGASGYLPEHTLETKVASYFMNADYIEQDVVLTRDNIPLVLHDIYLDEVTNVAEKFPARARNDSRFYAIDFDLAEIKTLRVVERFRPGNISSQFFPDRFPVWRSSFQLNSLEEEIELIQGMEGALRRIRKIYDGAVEKIHHAGIYVEIKQPRFHKIENKGTISEIVLSLLEKYNYKTRADKVILQCFDPIELKRIKNELKSDLVLVQLLEKDQISDGVNWTSSNGLLEISKFADGIGPEKDMLVNYDLNAKTVKPSEFYKEAKRLNLFIHPYTFRVDALPKYASSYKDLMKIFTENIVIDGIFSDFPDLTIEYVNSNIHSAGFSLRTTSFIFLPSIIVYLLYAFN